MSSLFWVHECWRPLSLLPSSIIYLSCALSWTWFCLQSFDCLRIFLCHGRMLLIFSYLQEWWWAMQAVLWSMQLEGDLCTHRPLLVILGLRLRQFSFLCTWALSIRTRVIFYLLLFIVKIWYQESHNFHSSIDYNYFHTSPNIAKCVLFHTTGDKWII